jgi:hypothetical protein
MTNDTDCDNPTGHASCRTDELLKRALTTMSTSVSSGPPQEKGARTETAELTPFLSRGKCPDGRTNILDDTRFRLRQQAIITRTAPFSANLYRRRAVFATRVSFLTRRYPNSPRSEMKSLASHSRFGGRIFEAGCHVRQGFRGSHDVAWINVIKEVTSNAREVNRPRGPHLGHAPRSEPGDISSCVGRTRGLRHESTRLEFVHQASRSARREIGRSREVRHSQLAIGGLRKVHDRGVLARGQTNASDQVAVEESREYLKNSHLGTPERILICRHWFDSGHFHDINLLRQATGTPRETATTTYRFHYLIDYRKLGVERVK